MQVEAEDLFALGYQRFDRREDGLNGLDIDSADAVSLPMTARLDRHDWSTTPLGDRAGWPAALRILTDMMMSAGHAMCMMWGPERTFLYNDAYVPVLGARHPRALGQATSTVWAEIWNDIAPLIDRTFAGETSSFVEMPLTMTRYGAAEQTWWDFSYSPVRDETGRIVGLLNTTLEVTGRVLAERDRAVAVAALQESESFLTSVLSASTDCVKVLELDGTLSFMSEGGMRTMEISDFNNVQGCPWPSFLKADGPDHAKKAIEAAKRGETTHFEGPADTYLGNERYWSISVSPIQGAAGDVTRILSVSRDHTELNRGREQQKLLNDELTHRIRNTMSVVQAIAHQTLGKVTDADAMASFAQRLAALSSAHDVLSKESWSSADLCSTARKALETFGQDRFAIAGPDVVLGPRATLALAMMLHELATNAVKYGSLSTNGGRVHLGWTVDLLNEPSTLTLTWAERGGPPAVTPTRKGFGSRIVRMGLTGSGGVNVNYGSEGLTVVANAPLYQIQEA